MAIKVSKKIQDNINKLESMTFDSLKDFQKKTVERVAALFENNQNRVLVADEVGLGKTMIAKGVIAKLAQIRIKEGDDLFKVVYICSNQGIARQNIKTLDIVSMLPEYSKDPLVDTSDTRLSMQHLKITQQENDPRLKEKYIQIIPLTPGTSFEVSQGCGSVRERALLWAILKRAKEFDKDERFYLRRIFVLDAPESGYWYLDEYDGIVKKAEKESNNEYPQNVIKELRKAQITIDGKPVPVFDYSKQVIQLRKERNCIKSSNCQKCKNYKACKKLSSELRVIFAKISTENLNPDLVIMDEFQRFNQLLHPDANDASGQLAKRFLQENPDDLDRKTRVLLLSATPYKLYSTMEEMDECSEEDNPYKEFYNVMDFLFEKEKDEFHKKWDEYTETLQAAKRLGFEVVKNKKLEAEDAMYQGTCRTERISVMEDGDFIDDSSKNKHLNITQGDIQSYIQGQELLNETGINQNLQTDYVKSCPFLMSFMEKYKVKDNIKKAFVNEDYDFSLLEKELLWINSADIEKYKELPDTNARLSLLKDIVFQQNAENLLWVPPCRPYYKLEGPYKDISNFSKTLIFSAWEMVPRMISTLLSYELERKIYGNKYKYSDERKIARRLEFRLNKKQEPNSMILFSLIYPSETLAALYNPIDCMNRNLSLAEVEKEIKEKVFEKLTKLKKYENTSTGNANEASNRWYYFAPMLMDNNLKHAKAWLEALKNQDSNEAETEENRFSNYLTALENILNSDIALGKMPQDLVDYLCDVTLGSFAVCYYRACKQYNDVENSVLRNATDFAKEFMKNFNSPEFISVVDNLYSNEGKSYLQNVLHYCKDGCFQGMLDEYIHLLQRNNNGSFQRDLINNLSLLQTAHYEIDTMQAFENDVINTQRKLAAKRNEEIEKLEVRSLKINMRSHFAVCFSKTADKNEGERKENLRNAFNSPLRPFVLASTSIGQEGLDFHNYCRKIMHWNLPSNPIDLEQREGRINRYKCLAIRQNIAQKYGSEQIEKNLWEELFEKAEVGEKKDNQSELIPFWCFGKNQKIKIERIVPIYPMSSDITRYERLIKILSMYRMTLGQPRQEELLEYVFSNCDENEIKKMKNLFINLSPWEKRNY